MILAGPGKNSTPIQKITKAKRSGGMAQVVEHFPSKNKSKALSSKHSITKK
jgi:hypothetical protein